MLFFDTLGFLTRLAPARVIPEGDMNRCIRWMPAVGLVLGVVVALLPWLGLFGKAPWVQAWVMVVLSVYLTRGFHCDGLADICDATTTHADPDRFWQVVKDSRSGAFAIIGLILALGGEALLFHEMALREAFGTVVWVFILGRAASVALAYGVHHLARPGLGKLYMDGATLNVALGAGIFALISGFILAGPLTTLAGMALAGLALIPLYRLAEHVNGANGDFLGCAVILGELAAGLGFALVM
ncbi:adenosylcobinamide-GDP ribazoletransferase [Pseudodesulfovibrio sp.]|uniref:adenosylcobinamide-GDP ribazoletransferase n=1 Tax=unclassified Pseudodesulfovibrio TaxID=2661612 RepID=UPI003AFF84C9